MENKLTFEEGLQELEQLARALEAGTMTLEDSFAAFERANKLKSELEKMLDEGDRRIRVLTGIGEEEVDPEDVQ